MWLGETIDTLPTDITENVTPGHVLHSEIYKTIFRAALYFKVLPSGDVTGETDRINLNNALAEASIVKATVEMLAHPDEIPWYIDDEVQSGLASLWGQGNGDALHAATLIIATTADARISFGTYETGPTGGVCGNFTFDGDDIAVFGTYIGLCVSRTFINMDAVRCLINRVWENSQNNIAINCSTSYSGEANVLYLGSPQANQTYTSGNFETQNWHSVFTDEVLSGPIPGYLAGYPYGNKELGGIKELGGANGGIWQKVGDFNGVTDIQLVLNAPDEADPFVRVDAGNFFLTAGTVASNTADSGTAFQVAPGAAVFLDGTPTIVGVHLAYDGVVIENSFVRMVSVTDIGDAPQAFNRYGETGLGSQTCFAGLLFELTIVYQDVPSAYFILDPASWPVAVDGRTLQWRLRTTFHGMDDGDVVSAKALNLTDAEVFAETFRAAGVDGTAEAVSGWMTFPDHRIIGSVQVKNGYDNDGYAASAMVDIRIA